MSSTDNVSIRRAAALLLCAMLTALLLLPTAARAQNRVVRVGWYESPFNQTDETGRRSGYAYEYQQKIAAYTGWTYEYVMGSWPELLEMLMDGRIDLLSDVSYTEERTESMLFSSLPMGEEDYYLFIAPENREISPEDYATFNGKRVGVDKGSVQADFFRTWAEANGVQAELVEMTESLSDALGMLRRGVIDMYIALDAYLDIDDAVPVCKIGSSEYYFAVSRSASDLLPELNTAMSRIREENPNFNQQLNERYIKASGVNLFLSTEETAWLADHGAIRVGYQDNYMAFCASDPGTGELTGALKEYLRVASDCLENAHLDFQPVAFPTAAAAMEAMKAGEVDCVFPANLTDYDGEVEGFFITPALMRTDMSAVIRESDREDFFEKQRIAVAVNAGNPNYDMFLLDHFPDWRTIYYEDTPTCLRAIADGQADCLLISSYRFNNIADLCRKYDLVTMSTGVEMDYCFAVNRADITLYSILSKITCLVPAATVNSALSFYFTEDAKLTPWDLLRQNLGVVIAVLAGIALGYLLLALRSARTERKAGANRQLIAATETDELTGLYTRGYFHEYAERLHRETPDRPMDAIALNIEQFHAVNAMKGQSFGDQALQVLGLEIAAFLRENGGIATREESDRFTLYCPHEEDWHPLLERLQRVLDTLSPNTSIRLRMGVAPWQEDTEPLRQIEQARTACGLAQGNVKEQLVVFDEALRERDAFERRLLNDLRRAVENREFEVHYQPKLDIRTEPPRLKGAEALVRWRHPELGMIQPGDFIPLLERSGEIGVVDKYVWSETARQAAVWKNARGITVPVSVNLSRVDVLDALLENVLDALLEENGLSYGDLRLEITESACSENGAQIIDVIERLRRKGFAIEMDDFGAGCSSLKMLSAMPIDVLKMDLALVSGIEREEKALQLAELILGIAERLRIPVIAEGVETAAQLQLLKRLGCTLAQGFYFSPPALFRYRAQNLGNAAVLRRIQSSF